MTRKAKEAPVAEDHFTKYILSIESGDYIEAMKELLEAIKLNPDFLKTRKEEIRSVLPKEPGRSTDLVVTIYKLLGQYYVRSGDYNEAVITFTEALKVNPQDAGLYLNLVDAHVRLGKIDAAIKNYEEAERLIEEGEALGGQIEAERKAEREARQKELVARLRELEALEALGRQNIEALRRQLEAARKAETEARREADRAEREADRARQKLLEVQKQLETERKAEIGGVEDPRDRQVYEEAKRILREDKTKTISPNEARALAIKKLIKDGKIIPD